jgi:hypothetical protein
MIKSPDKAMPCPNKFIAIATPSAGRPALMATGSSTAPSRATAGDGQKNHEITIIKMPIVQYASAGERISLAKGEIITSLMPEAVSVLLIATIIEITRMVDSSSVMAKIKLLKTLLTDELRDPVAVIAIRKIPRIHKIVVSLLITMNPIIPAMNNT